MVRATHPLPLPLKHILEPIHQSKTDKPRNPVPVGVREVGSVQTYACPGKGLGTPGKLKNIGNFEAVGEVLLSACVLYGQPGYYTDQHKLC